MKHPLFRIDYGPAFRAARIERRTLVVPAALKAFHGRSILFMTDLHLSPMFPERALLRLLAQAAALKPDILCLGGDLAETGEDQARAVALLRALRPALGAFAVLGNNDCEHMDGGGCPLPEALRRIGVQTLVDAEAVLELPGGRLRVAGLNVLQAETAPSAPFFADAEEEDLRLLMAHYPKSILRHRDDCARLPHLALAGHTHGGQFRFLGLTPYSIGFERRKYSRQLPVEGWTEVPGFPLLISPGVGTSRLPFRLNVPPTIHLISISATR